MSVFFKIGNTDFSHLVMGMKVGYETLVADGSGRNANGDTVLDIMSRKYKLYMTFRPMTSAEMQSLMAAIADFVIPITFKNPRTGGTLTTITCYTGTPEPELYSYRVGGKALYKQFSFNFIEM